VAENFIVVDNSFAFSALTALYQVALRGKIIESCFNGNAGAKK
jgi:hypothetical protein